MLRGCGSGVLSSGVLRVCGSGVLRGCGSGFLATGGGPLGLSFGPSILWARRAFSLMVSSEGSFAVISSNCALGSTGFAWSISGSAFGPNLGFGKGLDPLASTSPPTCSSSCAFISSPFTFDLEESISPSKFFTTTCFGEGLGDDLGEGFGLYLVPRDAGSSEGVVAMVPSEEGAGGLPSEEVPSDDPDGGLLFNVPSDNIEVSCSSMDMGFLSLIRGVGLGLGTGTGTL